MGCYDYVRFENKDCVLPDSLPVAGIVFQTKDLGGNFSTIVIGHDGSLVMDDMWKLFQDIEFDFYTVVDGVFYEYKACFQNGVLIKIKVVLWMFNLRLVKQSSITGMVRSVVGVVRGMQLSIADTGVEDYLIVLRRKQTIEVKISDVIFDEVRS